MRGRLWIAALLVLMVALVACGARTPTTTPMVTTEGTEEATPPSTGEPAPTEETAEPRGDLAFPAAEIQNDEGGPVLITGDVEYTNPFFTVGVAEPLIILEDQGGFVARDRNFVIPEESQVMGTITTDFDESPFSYSVNVPIEPDATLNDVDSDGESDTGVMIYAVAYWNNMFGDPFLEERDQGGGGWSGAYASTRVSDDRDNYLEVVGGKYVIYAPDDQQGFPSGFGADGLLFTEDDPIVSIPQGWTVVDMDTDPFTFDRSREPDIDLIEPEGAALDDFSGMSYTEAFDAMLEKFRTEYAFTEYKEIDWDAIAEEFRPRFEQAERRSDVRAYHLALRDFIWSIPDAHVGMDTSVLGDLFQQETSGGLGMSLAETDDRRVLVVFVAEGSPADQAGITFGAEILEINGQPIGDAISASVPWSSPFSNEEVKRLQQLRYVIRFPVGTEVQVTFQRPGGGPTTATMTTVADNESFAFSSFYRGVTGLELPVEFEILDNGYGYVRIYSFFDNQVLTIQLWERMMETLNQNEIPGLIIDLRQNGGGSGWLADQMAAYFFDDRVELGNTGYYDDSTGEFFFDEGDTSTFIPPPDEELRYHGPIALIVGPACASACEFFAYDLTLEDRARIVGHYPTAGAGGSVEDFLMPEQMSVRMTIGRAVDVEGNIHVEGTGVPPTVDIPVTLESLIAQFQEGGDVLLEAAVQTLNTPVGGGVAPSGPPSMDGSRDFIALIQANTPILNDMAREEYEITSQPGETYVYTIAMPTSDEVLWFYAWCTADEAQLADNWSKIQLQMQIDGQAVPLDQFGMYEGSDFGQPCRIYYIVLSDWPVGEHVLSQTVAFTAPLNDGFEDYPAGTHVYEYHVIVQTED